jgi:hypothetical protein
MYILEIAVTLPLIRYCFAILRMFEGIRQIIAVSSSGLLARVWIHSRHLIVINIGWYVQYQ